MRRLLAVAALTTLIVLSMGEAALAAPGVYFQSPPTPSGGSTVKGGQSIEASAEAPTVLGLGLVGPTVKSITVTIRPKGKGTPVANTQEGNSFKMQWDTNKSTPFNGAYDLEGVATLSDGKTLTAKVENIKVENPASAPENVKAGLEGSSAVVRWSANPEPDITSYKVSRSVEGGGFNHLASVDADKGTSFTDGQAPIGKPLKYQVAAIRRNASGDGAIESSASTSGEFTIPAPAAPPPGPDGQPVPIDPATGNPVVTPTLPLAPAAPAFMAPTLPKAKAAPPPIYKSRPSEISFAETLPFGEAPPPQKFDDLEEGGSDLAGSSGLTSSLTASNPIKFIAIGIVLLGASFIMARQSRKILQAGDVTLFADDFATGVDFSSLGEIELPPMEIEYPTFKVGDEPLKVTDEPFKVTAPAQPGPTVAHFAFDPEVDTPPADVEYPGFAVPRVDSAAR